LLSTGTTLPSVMWWYYEMVSQGQMIDGKIVINEEIDGTWK